MARKWYTNGHFHSFFFCFAFVLFHNSRIPLPCGRHPWRLKNHSYFAYKRSKYIAKKGQENVSCTNLSMCVSLWNAVQCTLYSVGQFTFNCWQWNIPWLRINYRCCYLIWALGIVNFCPKFQIQNNEFCFCVVILLL